MNASTESLAKRPASAAPDLATFVRELAADLGGQLDLPGFPDVVVRIQRLLAEERTSTRDVVKLVNAEPALAARLLQIANSAAFHPGGKPLTELPSAVTRLGFNTVHGIVTSFAVRQLERQEWLKGIRPALETIWQASTGVAALAAVAGPPIGVRADEALSAGLFHQLGTLYILTRAHRAGVAVGTESAWASDIAGWHPTIGRAILESWGMPERLTEAVERQDALLGEDDHGELAPLTCTVAAAKAYHALVTHPDRPDRAPIEQRLRSLPCGNQSLYDVVAEAHSRTGKLRESLAL